MATDDLLPAACAFAVSVLAEFGDSVELVANAIGPVTSASAMPSTTVLVQHISNAHLNGVSGAIALHPWDNVLITNNSARPVILGVQQDGSIQIVG